MASMYLKKIPRILNQQENENLMVSILLSHLCQMPHKAKLENSGNNTNIYGKLIYSS